VWDLTLGILRALQADRRERRVTGRRQEQRRKLEQLVTRGRKRERSQDEDDNSNDDGSDEDAEGIEATTAPGTWAKAARRQSSPPPQHRPGGGRQSSSPRPSPVRGLVISLMPCEECAVRPLGCCSRRRPTTDAKAIMTAADLSKQFLMAGSKNRQIGFCRSHWNGACPTRRAMTAGAGAG